MNTRNWRRDLKQITVFTDMDSCAMHALEEIHNLLALLLSWAISLRNLFQRHVFSIVRRRRIGDIEQGMMHMIGIAQCHCHYKLHVMISFKFGIIQTPNIGLKFAHIECRGKHKNCKETN